MPWLWTDIKNYLTRHVVEIPDAETPTHEAYGTTVFDGFDVPGVKAAVFYYEQNIWSYKSDTPILGTHDYADERVGVTNYQEYGTTTFEGNEHPTTLVSVWDDLTSVWKRWNGWRPRTNALRTSYWFFMQRMMEAYYRGLQIKPVTAPTVPDPTPAPPPADPVPEPTPTDPGTGGKGKGGGGTKGGGGGATKPPGGGGKKK